MSLMLFSPFCRLIAGKKNMFSPYTSRVVATLFPHSEMQYSLGCPVTKAINKIMVSQYDLTKFDMACHLVSQYRQYLEFHGYHIQLCWPCIHTSLSISLCCVYRVIHLSSGLGNLAKLSKPLQNQIMSPDLTVEGLSNLMDQFLRWTPLDMCQRHHVVWMHISDIHWVVQRL